MKIKEETYGIVWGTVLLVIGLIILLMALSNVLNVAQNPAETIEQWVPEQTQGPAASFVWTSNDKSVDFEDLSVEGDFEISSWIWNFGDDESSNQQSPSHVYSETGSHRQVIKCTKTLIYWANLSSSHCETHWQRVGSWLKWVKNARRLK